MKYSKLISLIAIIFVIVGYEFFAFPLNNMSSFDRDTTILAEKKKENIHIILKENSDETLEVIVLEKSLIFNRLRIKDQHEILRSNFVSECLTLFSVFSYEVRDKTIIIYDSKINFRIISNLLVCFFAWKIGYMMIGWLWKVKKTRE